MRSIERAVGCSVSTVDKLLRDAGEVALAYHDEHVRGVTARDLELCARQGEECAAQLGGWRSDDRQLLDLNRDRGRVEAAARLPGRRSGCGLRLDADDDLHGRLGNRVQLTTDGHKAYLSAVEEPFGHDIDYAMPMNLYRGRIFGCRRAALQRAGMRRHAQGSNHRNPDRKHISTSYTEQASLTMRIAMRRFTRLTNGFSKKLENHAHMVAPCALWYSFVQVHKTLRTSPAMAAGIETRLWSMEDVVRLIEHRENLRSGAALVG